MNNFELSEESKNLFRKCIETYKEEFDEEIKYRKYKWESLKMFQDNWDIKAEDFKEMIDKSIPRKDFLDARPSGEHHYFKDIVIKLIESGKSVRKYFENLYDENLDLDDRFKNFQSNFTFTLNGKDVPMDVRIFSILLALKYPEKYFMYQFDVMKSVKEKLNIDYKGKGFEGFSKSLCIFNKLREIVLSDKELLRKIDNYINDNKDMYDNDKSYSFLVQDIYWSIHQWKNEKSENGYDLYKNEKEYNEGDKEENMSKKNPLNQILYGPAGTGKTYNTVIKALKIIEGEKFKDGDYKKDLLPRFNYLKNQGQIKFITFHQSYSYEDFIEGIKPITNSEVDSNENNNLDFDIKDGIFKQLVDFAKPIGNIIKNNGNDIFDDKSIFYKMSLGRSYENIYDYCIKNNVIALGYGDNIDFSNCKTQQEIKDKCEKNNIKNWTLTAMNYFKLILKKGDIVIITNGNRKFRAIAKVVGEYEFNDTVEIQYYHFRKVEYLWVSKEEKGIDYFKIKNKEFSQQTIYWLDNKDLKINDLNNIILDNRKREEDKNYVFIIDEINRGNISKIFGELITLIEEDKRNENWSVKLPYSNESFYVPKNVYIIGTMNTSDRSIASIDIALRRRFKFVEMMPNSELLKEKEIEGINLKDLLDNINKKITILLDRDHQIGHSYFIKVENIEDLKDVWFNEIIPLLNEYFYNDFEKLLKIIKSFIKENEIENDFKEYSDKYYEFKTIKDYEDDKDNKKFIEDIEKIYNKDSDKNKEEIKEQENNTEENEE